MRYSYGDSGSRLCGLDQRRVHGFLCRCIESAFSFVKKENLRVSYECSCDGNTLSLATRKLVTIVSTQCCRAVGKRTDELPRIGGTKRSLQTGIVELRPIRPALRMNDPHAILSRMLPGNKTGSCGTRATLSR